MKYVFCLLPLCLFAAGLFAADTNIEELMRKVQPFDRGEPLSAVCEAVITAKNGKESIMTYNMYSDRDENEIRALIEFTSPKTYQGTRILTTVPAEGGTPEVLMRREPLVAPIKVNASNPNTSFFGMDFASGDMNPRNPSFDSYNLIGEDTLADGTPVTIVEVKPLKDKIYDRVVHFIDMDKQLIVRSEMFNNKNRMIKVFEVLESKPVDGLWSAVKSKMTTVNAGTSTVLTYTDLSYGEDVSGYVTEEYLKTGKLD